MCLSLWIHFVSSGVPLNFPIANGYCNREKDTCLGNDGRLRRLKQNFRNSIAKSDYYCARWHRVNQNRDNFSCEPNEWVVSLAHSAQSRLFLFFTLLDWHSGTQINNSNSLHLSCSGKLRPSPYDNICIVIDLWKIQSLHTYWFNFQCSYLHWFHIYVETSRC